MLAELKASLSGGTLSCVGSRTFVLASLMDELTQLVEPAWACLPLGSQEVEETEKRFGMFQTNCLLQAVGLLNKLPNKFGRSLGKGGTEVPGSGIFEIWS